MCERVGGEDVETMNIDSYVKESKETGGISDGIEMPFIRG